MSRFSFSNETLDSMLSTLGQGWTRDVPLGFQARIFPGITPAHEGTGRGRGAAVFDVWRETVIGGLKVEQAASFKITQGDRPPRAPAVSKGTDRHIESVIAGMMENPLGLICLHHNPADNSWKFCALELSALLADHGIESATVGRGKGKGSGKVLTVGDSSVRSPAGATYTYTVLSVNVKAAGAEWRDLDDPIGWDFAPYVSTYPF